MLGLEMLDVAIGLIFVYLLLSLVCSAVNELIELRLKKRSANLHRGIQELLGGVGAAKPNGDGGKPKDGANDIPDPVEQLYTHPLIFGLFKGEYKTGDKEGDKRTTKELPSYIPARTFALALMDIVSKDNESSYSGARGATAAKTSPQLAQEFERFRGAIAEWPNENLRDALIPLVDAAGNSMSGARENIEAWFNSSMDRVSGWYKRRTQKIILFLGLAITIAVNADTVTIVNSLSQDAALRSTLVAAAGERAKVQPNENADAPRERITQTMDTIRTLGLPVGWDRNDIRTIPTNFGGWLLKIFGWLLTATAISLGAPFWFDVLNKFMVIRSTVKPHEKSQEEGSEDRQVSGQRAPAGTAVTVTSNTSGAGAGEAASIASIGPFQPNEWAHGDPQEGIV